MATAATVGNYRDSACSCWPLEPTAVCLGTRYNYIAGADTYGTACDVDNEVRQVAKRPSTGLLKTREILMVRSMSDWPWSMQMFVQEKGKPILGRLFCCFFVHAEAIWCPSDSGLSRRFVLQSNLKPKSLACDCLALLTTSREWPKHAQTIYSKRLGGKDFMVCQHGLRIYVYQLWKCR